MARESHQLSIGDGRDWHFVNADWVDDEGGLIRVPADELRSDGDAMQGMHFAFARTRWYQDFTVRFEFNLAIPHSDIGIIFRARDVSHFYLLHFPNCGQASRAHHFWTVLSSMDGSGYMRQVKMEMVQRVSSTLNVWLPAEITVHGKRVIVRVGDYGHFEVEDDTYPAPGAIGLYCMAYDAPGAMLRNVVVEGKPATALPWPEDVRQPRNWSHPVPGDEPVWQTPTSLVQFPDGELLLPFGVQGEGGGEKFQDERAKPASYAVRSTDGGRTWTDPTPRRGDSNLMVWGNAQRLHLTPGGRLICLISGGETLQFAESIDRGHSWSQPATTSVPSSPPGCVSGAWGSMLNLDDGATLLFGAGEVESVDSANVWTWGSIHCKAFAVRSDDDGHTWSDPVNLDGPCVDAHGNEHGGGNLDLTEQTPMQLSNGRIMVFLRPIFSPWMWETWSDDGGRTWGPCVRGPFPGYATPNAVQTTSGALLFAHRLPQLTVHCSQDDGRTWQGTIIDSGMWAMGGMCEVEPDVVLYVYMDSFEGRMRRQLIRVTPAGLEPVRD